MHRLKRAASRWFSSFQIEGGPRIKGSLRETADTTRVSNFNTARRLLRTPEDTLAKPRDIILTPNKQRYLLAIHGDEYRETTLFRTFKLFEVHRQGTWKRPSTSTTAWTGLEESSGLTTVGQIWFAIEKAGDVSDKLRIPADEYELITGALLQEGDVVDNMTVQRVDEMLGVTVAEVKVV